MFFIDTVTENESDQDIRSQNNISSEIAQIEA